MHVDRPSAGGMKLIGYVLLKVGYDGAAGRDRAMRALAERISGLGKDGAGLMFRPYTVVEAAADPYGFTDDLSGDKPYHDAVVEVYSDMKGSGPSVMMMDAYNILHTLEAYDGGGRRAACVKLAMNCQLV